MKVITIWDPNGHRGEYLNLELIIVVNDDADLIALSAAVDEVGWKMGVQEPDCLDEAMEYVKRAGAYEDPNPDGN